MKQLIASKEKETVRFTEQISNLEKKNEELKDYIHKARGDPDDPMNAEKASKARQKILDQIAAAD